MHLPRNAQLWIRGYWQSRKVRRARRVPAGTPVDLLFCIADHFEPGHGEPGIDVERRRMDAWMERYPAIAANVRDADGRPPRHSFFFPAEVYRAEHLDRLGELCRAGLGEVEVHLHHDNDTPAQLDRTLSEFTRTLRERHGCLSAHPDGRPAWAFVHGNWALDNSRPDGRWCGVNDEISVLQRTGCFADFTFPSAPDISQTSTVNTIYYALDDPRAPKSHDTGTPLRVGQPAPEGGFLIVQGPLGFDQRRRRFGVLPGLENAAVDGSNPPTVARFRDWVDTAIGVLGRPEWVVIKVHTHGAIEKNAKVLLGPAMERFHADLRTHFNDGQRFRLHYVTAREVVNIVLAAEAGHGGNPHAYRDFRFPPPPLVS
jgi:hypothetical protein